MADRKGSVNKNRIQQSFLKLAAFDAESFHEQEISVYLAQLLAELGLTVERDEQHANIYAVLKGNMDAESRLFSAHMDTVKPGTGKKPVIHPDGRITSDGTTVLGADDISGLVSILEALRVIQEQALSHPDIEVLFTAAEEPYCEGSRYVDYSRIRAKSGYVLDLTGPVGTAACAAPTILAVSAQITGKAAHAGFAPQDGVNAVTVMAHALSRIPVGWVSDVTSVNFGLVSGGRASNIVPDEVRFEGEIRSMDHANALEQAEQIRRILTEEAEKLGASAHVEIKERIRAYKVPPEAAVVRRFLRAAGDMPRCSRPECITTNGGSDANRLNAHGIPTIVLACAMENCHSTEEYTTLEGLEASAELTLRLMTIEDTIET